MHQSLINDLTPDILHTIAANWNVQGEPKLISQIENFVYECNAGGAPFILRVSHEKHRSAELVLGELDWMAFLAAQEVSVAAPILSVNGNLVESVEHNGVQFHAAAFVKVRGRELDANDSESPTIFHNWGRLVGTLHATTRHYTPATHSIRPQWFEDDTLANAPRLLPDGDPARIELDRLMNWMRSLPKPANQFGMIHADVHTKNFFVDGGTLHLFDFDDCCYHWFMYDIAVVLWHAVPRRADLAERSRLGNALLKPFLEGYQTAYPLDPAWLTLLPEFLRFRDVFMLFTILKWWGDALTEGQRAWVEIVHRDIVDRVPVIKIADFALRTAD